MLQPSPTRSQFRILAPHVEVGGWVLVHNSRHPVIRHHSTLGKIGLVSRLRYKKTRYARCGRGFEDRLKNFAQYKHA